MIQISDMGDPKGFGEWWWTGTEEGFRKFVTDYDPKTLAGLNVVRTEKPQKKYRMVRGRVREVKE
jgi:hypothetical protein